MKILMTADTIGGVWNYSLTLAEALQSHGVQIYLATMGGPAHACDLANVQILESTFRLEWMENPWQDVRRAGDWLLNLERRLHPDVIHLNNFAHGALDWAAPTVMVGHSCVLSWWEAVHGCAAPAQWNRYSDKVRRGLQAAGTVIAPSRTMMNALETHYGPFKHTQVIPNAVRPNSNEQSGAGGFACQVLTAGRIWDEAKNIRALARAAKSIPWPIYVAGENQSPEGGIPETEELHLLGRLPQCDLNEWYAKSPIYAAPVKYEPFGLSILEAALSGCALVLGDIDSLRENWDDAALFVDPNDHDGLAAGLNELIENTSLRAGLSSAARTRAQQFSPGRMAGEYLQVYQAAVETMACA